MSGICVPCLVCWIIARIRYAYKQATSCHSHLFRQPIRGVVYSGACHAHRSPSKHAATRRCTYTANAPLSCIPPPPWRHVVAPEWRLNRSGVGHVLQTQSALPLEIGLAAALQGAGFTLSPTNQGEFLAALSGQRPTHPNAGAAHLRIDDMVRTLHARLDMPVLLAADAARLHADIQSRNHSRACAPGGPAERPGGDGH